MKDPLPFAKAFGLIFRNIRRYEPADPDFGAKLGISQAAALTIAYVGLAAGAGAMVGSAFVLARPLINFFWPSFVVAVLAIHFATHAFVSYGLYRLWYSHTRAGA